MDVFGTSAIIFFINDRDYLFTHTQLITLKDPDHRSRAQNIALGTNLCKSVY